MEFWIFSIIRLKDNFLCLADKMDKLIEAKALSLTEDTYQQCGDMFDLINKKAMIVNLKVIYDLILSSLNGKESDIIESYVNKESFESIAKRYGVYRSTVLKWLNKIVKKIIKKLNGENITMNWLENEYKNFPPLVSTVKKYKKEALNKKKDEPLRVIAKIPIIYNITL